MFSDRRRLVSTSIDPISDANVAAAADADADDKHIVKQQGLEDKRQPMHVLDMPAAAAAAETAAAAAAVVVDANQGIDCNSSSSSCSATGDVCKLLEKLALEFPQLCIEITGQPSDQSRVYDGVFLVSQCNVSTYSIPK